MNPENTNERAVQESVPIEKGAGDAEHGSSARKYQIRVDDDNFEIAAAMPTGQELLNLVRKEACRYELFQVIKCGEDQVIDPSEQIDLTRPGVEAFITALKHTVTIFVDGENVPLTRGEHTVAQIKTLAGVAAGYRLAEERHGVLHNLADDESLDIQGCERFESRPPSGGSS